MDKIVVEGGARLIGEVYISGAKNSALILYAASLLCNGKLTLSNVPALHDMHSMQVLIEHLGGKIEIVGASNKYGSKNRKAIIDCSNLSCFDAPYDLVRKMRSSFLVLGPLLTRFKKAKVSLPGGCAIGTRPVDMHLTALEKMGAKIHIENGYVIAELEKDKFQGADIVFEKVSVGATEHTIMAAVLANGITTIHNAALEPEIIDLAECLIAMGAKIKGYGTSTIMIEGVEELKEACHTVIPDRIEAGTFAIAAGITRSKLKICECKPAHLTALIKVLKECKISIESFDDHMIVDASQNEVVPFAHLETAPYPGFPTDLQAQLMVLFATSEYNSKISENIFENRFMHVAELNRLGAEIIIDNHTAIIHGKSELVGAEVMATDLRASVSLILAGLRAKGETIINRVYHLDRGYEHIELKLQECGVNIRRIGKPIL